MPRRRIAAALASAVIGLTLLTGCSDDVSCGLDQCTVTVQRETNAKVEVLGVEAKFVSADGDTVTLDVGGEQIQLTKGEQAVEVGGLSFTLSSVTQDAVKIEVAR
jgi:outer membrane murein-binding lipoprotein Lpp